MSVLYILAITFRNFLALVWVLQEEGIMHISCWMALRLEKSIEVPERTLNEFVSGHLIEAHL
jgi:hypothetical protein